MALEIPKITLGPRIGKPWSVIAATINAIIDAAGSGSGGEHFPRLIVDSGGYIAADYGEEAADNGDG